MTAFRFRLILCLHLALALAALAVPYVFPGALSPAITEAYANEPVSWIFSERWMLIVVVLLALVFLAGMAGMFLFKPWGRTLSLYMSVACYFLLFFMGPSVFSAAESALLDMSNVLWGAALALAYYSPLSSRFAPPLSK